jgi:hypothetical protein
MQPSSGGFLMKSLMDDLQSLNRELRILSEYQILLERRIQRVFNRLEEYIKRSESNGESR